MVWCSKLIALCFGDSCVEFQLVFFFWWGVEGGLGTSEIEVPLWRSYNKESG